MSAEPAAAHGASLFRRRRGAVPVTEDAGDRPNAILLRPDHHEFGDSFASPRRQFAEAVFAFLDGSIVLDRIDAERCRDQLALHLSANVSANAVDQRVALERRTAGVVVEGDL